MTVAMIVKKNSDLEILISNETLLSQIETIISNHQVWVLSDYCLINSVWMIEDNTLLVRSEDKTLLTKIKRAIIQHCKNTNTILLDGKTSYRMMDITTGKFVTPATVREAFNLVLANSKLAAVPENK